MTADNLDHHEAIQKLKSLVEGVQFAMLTTIHPSGLLHSRPMSTQEIDPSNATLWFFSADPSPKTQELNSSNQVNVSYSRPNGRECYISVSGMATVVHDRVKMKQLWKETFRAWFPKGLEDPNLSLIRVDMEEAQYWDTDSTVTQILKFALAFVRNEKYEGGEVRKLSFQ